MQLKGKNVYITGGTGGIGRPLVALLEENGAQVRCYDRATDGNLTKNIDHISETLKLDPPDILINMAGYNELDYCENQNVEDIVALNMTVPMRLAQAVLPHMKKVNSGQIVNVGSMTAVIPLPHLTAYVAAKAGLKAFSDSLRRELGGTNIKITQVLPRAVATQMNTGLKSQLNIATKVTEDDPVDIAQRIYEAMIRYKSETRIGWPERLFAVLNSLCPYLIDKGLQNNRQIGEALLYEHTNNKTF